VRVLFLTDSLSDLDGVGRYAMRLIEGLEVSYTDAGVAALNAGCDMVLLCNQSLYASTAVDELLEGLSESLLKGRWDASEESEHRRLALLPSATAPTWDALMRDPGYMHCLDLASTL